MPNVDSARNILNDAAQELGLPPATFNNALADPTGYQMLGLMNSLGDELTRVHDWQFLEQVANFVGDGVTSTFPLPVDFGRQINQTQWDVSNRRPLQGPDNAQMWGWSQYGIVSVGIFYRYRILGNQLAVFPTPALNQQLAFYYITKNWVEDGNNAGTYKPKITLDSDIPRFDKRLMIAGLKLKLWNQKGFDTDNLKQEFDFVLQTEKGQNQGAPVIDLSNGRGRYLLGWGNVPEASWS